MDILGPAGEVRPETIELIKDLSHRLPVRSVAPVDRALLILDALGSVAVVDFARLLGVHVWRAYDILGQLVAGGLARRLARDPGRSDKRRGPAPILLTEAGQQAARDARRRLGGADRAGLDVSVWVGHSQPRNALDAALVVGRIDTVGARVLVALLLLGRGASYSELRTRAACGERSMRAAVHGLRRRGLLERAVLTDRRAGAVFEFRLTSWGRESALRIVGDIDAEVRRVAFAVALSAGQAA